MSSARRALTARVATAATTLGVSMPDRLVLAAALAHAEQEHDLPDWLQTLLRRAERGSV